MDNMRILDITIHESRYIGSHEEREPQDFTIEIEFGITEDDPNPNRIYLHMFRRQMIDFFKQFDIVKSKCGLVSDKDRIDKILDMEARMKNMAEHLSLTNEEITTQSGILATQEKLIRHNVELLENMESRITAIENIKVKGGKLVD